MRCRVLTPCTVRPVWHGTTPYWLHLVEVDSSAVRLTGLRPSVSNATKVLHRDDSLQGRTVGPCDWRTAVRPLTCDARAMDKLAHAFVGGSERVSAGKAPPSPAPRVNDTHMPLIVTPGMTCARPLGYLRKDHDERRATCVYRQRASPRGSAQMRASAAHYAIPTHPSPCGLEFRCQRSGDCARY